VYGGFDVPEIMSSRSTYLRAGIGGVEGRALKENDFLPFKKLYPGHLKKFPWSAGGTIYPDLSVRKIRVIKGPEFDQFTEQSVKVFFTESYTISNASDRMGYRLNGPALETQCAAELLSSAVTFGTVQVPSGGLPIILMADRQTTGGYPRMAQVIGADLPLLAQIPPGQKITFELLTLAQAQALLVAREHQMNQLQQTLNLKYD
jgi:antagonist of KipI